MFLMAVLYSYKSQILISQPIANINTLEQVVPRRKVFGGRSKNFVFVLVSENTTAINEY
jgi:hypothetical protein